MITETDWAYLAGIIDGEGSVCICKAGYNNYADKTHPNGRVQLRPTISIVNTDKTLIEWIVDTLANINVHCKIVTLKSQRRKKWKPCYHIQVVGFDNLQKIAKVVRPFLKVKAKKLELLEEFISIRQSDDSRRKPYGEREWQIREDIRVA